MDHLMPFRNMPDLFQLCPFLYNYVRFYEAGLFFRSAIGVVDHIGMLACDRMLVFRTAVSDIASMLDKFFLLHFKYPITNMI